MDKQPHLLVVDDDREIRTLISQFLTKHGYRVSSAANGAEMMQVLNTSRIDLIVLDLMMPGEDGLSLCRRPARPVGTIGRHPDHHADGDGRGDRPHRRPGNGRRRLSAQTFQPARTAGPRQGRAAPRPPACRSGPRPSRDKAGADASKAGGSTSPSAELWSPDNVLVQLSAGEFDLLVAFVEHPQRVLTRDQLLDLARGRSAMPFDRSIDVQVSRLRRKIEPDPKEPTMIKTVRSGGYIFTLPP